MPANYGTEYSKVTVTTHKRLLHKIINHMVYFRWARQHEYIEKLNMQAVLNTANQEDEFVKEHLISVDKV